MRTKFKKIEAKKVLHLTDTIRAWKHSKAYGDCPYLKEESVLWQYEMVGEGWEFYTVISEVFYEEALNDDDERDQEPDTSLKDFLKHKFDNFVHRKTWKGYYRDQDAHDKLVSEHKIYEVYEPDPRIMSKVATELYWAIALSGIFIDREN